MNSFEDIQYFTNIHFIDCEFQNKTEFKDSSTQKNSEQDNENIIYDIK